jgi:hypothetical protein
MKTLEETIEDLKSVMAYENGPTTNSDFEYSTRSILQPLFLELQRLHQLEDSLPIFAARERQVFIDEAARLCFSLRIKNVYTVADYDKKTIEHQPSFALDQLAKLALLQAAALWDAREQARTDTKTCDVRQLEKKIADAPSKSTAPESAGLTPGQHINQIFNHTRAKYEQNGDMTPFDSHGVLLQSIIQYLNEQHAAPPPEPESDPYRRQRINAHERMCLENFDAFKSMLPGLLGLHRGEFVILREGRVRGYGPDLRIALNRAHALFTDGMFSIQLITDDDEVCRFHRTIPEYDP